MKKTLLLLAIVGAVVSGCRSTGDNTQYHQNISNQPSQMAEPGSPPVTPSPLNQTPPP